MPTQVYDPIEHKMKTLRLPAFLAPDAYVPIDGWMEWWERVSTKYAWCGRCLVARTREEHDAHKKIHHKDWTGGGTW